MTIPAALLEGYRNFRTGRYQQEVERYLSLAETQEPETLVLSCADSRVDPATIFAAGPGELFVVRNVAALAPPYDPTGGLHGVSAAVEFAVGYLKVKQIVVMGHSFCGGVKASLAAKDEDLDLGLFIRPWVEMLSEARDRMLADPDCPKDDTERLHLLESLAVMTSIENLKGFPFVKNAIEQRALKIHGARFSIAAGELQWLDPETGAFSPVAYA